MAITTARLTTGQLSTQQRRHRVGIWAWPGLSRQVPAASMSIECINSTAGAMMAGRMLKPSGRALSAWLGCRRHLPIMETVFHRPRGLQTRSSPSIPQPRARMVKTWRNKEPGLTSSDDGLQSGLNTGVPACCAPAWRRVPSARLEQCRVVKDVYLLSLLPSIVTLKCSQDPLELYCQKLKRVTYCNHLACSALPSSSPRFPVSAWNGGDLKSVITVRHNSPTN